MIVQLPEVQDIQNHPVIAAALSQELAQIVF
jgi:hypothetical protein